VTPTPCPSHSAPASAEAEMSPDDAVRVLRDKIIADLDKEPAREYELSSLLWDKATSCFPNSRMRCDGAWFYLNLRTGKLRAKVGTYPNGFGASYGDAFELSASEFHRIAVEYDFSPVLKEIETEQDWARLFDDALKAAVKKAFTAVQQKEEQAWERQRRQYAIQIPAALAARSPKMDIQVISLELKRRFGASSLMVTRNNGVYCVYYRLMATSPTHNQDFRRIATDAEAAWIEEKVDCVVADPDSDTRQSILGGDTMNILIRREGGSDVSLDRTWPIRKYTNLMSELEKLAEYGSIEAQQ